MHGLTAPIRVGGGVLRKLVELRESRVFIVRRESKQRLGKRDGGRTVLLGKETAEP